VEADDGLLDLRVLVLRPGGQVDQQRRRRAAKLVVELDVLAGLGAALPLHVAVGVAEVLLAETVKLLDNPQRRRLVLEVLDLVFDDDLLIVQAIAHVMPLIGLDDPRADDIAGLAEVELHVVVKGRQLRPVLPEERLASPAVLDEDADLARLKGELAELVLFVVGQLVVHEDAAGQRLVGVQLAVGVPVEGEGLLDRHFRELLHQDLQEVLLAEFLPEGGPKPAQTPAPS